MRLTKEMKKVVKDEGITSFKIYMTYDYKLSDEDIVRVLKQAKEDGFYAVDFAFGPEEAMGAAMLVNTVPAPVVTRVIIKELPRDAYILDIASKPGGTDFACAKEFGIRADLVLGIPGKYAPKESAYILERSMERFAAK